MGDAGKETVATTPTAFRRPLVPHPPAQSPSARPPRWRSAMDNRSLAAVQAAIAKLRAGTPHPRVVSAGPPHPRAVSAVSAGGAPHPRACSAGPPHPRAVTAVSAGGPAQPRAVCAGPSHPRAVRAGPSLPRRRPMHMRMPPPTSSRRPRERRSRPRHSGSSGQRGPPDSGDPDPQSRLGTRVLERERGRAQP
jgi:hypothetical protein